jgi:DUF4097 and DUF4098 domain-containing protein YvlB
MEEPMTRLALGALSCALALSLPAAAAESREVKKTVPARTGLTVEVENLAGTVRIEAATGSDVEIVAQLHAEGDDDAETKKLLSLLDVAFEDSGSRVGARAKYPIDSYGTIHYPDPRHRAEEHGFLSFLGIDRSTVRYQGRRVTVVSGRRRHAPTLYADFRLRVPAGVSVSVRHAVGLVTGGGVKGATAVEAQSADVKLHGIGGGLEIRTGSGDVLVRDVGGESRVETGSGDVSFDGARGAAALHTGSGDVTLKNVRGDVKASTGSGDVTLTDVEAKTVSASTGSGNVVLERLSGSLEIETGSGDVHATRVTSLEKIHVETGSGNLVLRGDLSAARDVKLDTSSGDVSVSLEAPLAMRLEARTSSGDISVDLPDMRTIRRGDHALVAEVGSGGATFHVQTSSGNVRVEAR